jgi:hypothetical protein
MQEYVVKVYNNGTEWHQNDQLHRIDGPAVEWVNGSKEWYVNGQRHRLDGPAVEYADGTKMWYVNGDKLTEAQFNQRTNPQPVELTLDEIAERFGIPVEQLKIKK